VRISMSERIDTRRRRGWGPRRLTLVLLLAAFVLCAGAGRAAAQSQCKKVKRQALAADFERYKKETSRGLEYKWELINCREALPVLRRYALDSDPHIRGLVGDFLARSPSAEALRILVSQVTRYPLDANVVHQINAYPCEDIRKARQKGLSAAIIGRLKARPEHADAEERYVLGCLAPKDPEARRSLEGMRGADSPESLDAGRPAVVSAVAPAYPPVAKASRIKGEVVVEVKLDAQGKVTSAAVVSGNELLRKASEKAAAAWRFAPADEAAKVRTARLTFAYLHAEDVDLTRTGEETTVVFMPPYRVEVTLHPSVVSQKRARFGAEAR
jgi:TonB family protein